MSESLRFDGRVVVVTGAGQGLGRSHAMHLAARGARVVVNDLNASAVVDVVDAIAQAGGEAVASVVSVEDGPAIVQTALDKFGRIDVVINNAGLLRDAGFAKLSDADWELVQRIHVKGAYAVTHAAWEHMRTQGYGRIVFTSSAAGLYGNFGQSNYAAAKMALVGLGQTLALEGKKKNIHVNVIAPVAGTAMTATILPAEIVQALRPELVSPLVAWLCHESCDATGAIFEVGGGFIAQLRWERTVGHAFLPDAALTPEQVRGAWSSITDFTRTTHPRDIHDAAAAVLGNLAPRD